MGRPIVRLVCYLLGGAVLIVALIAGAIRLDQYALRWRAECLQSDIRSLELRKSTYADTRRLEDRWLDRTKESVCQPFWCDLAIFLNNTGSQHLGFLVNHPAAFAVYHTLGGRVAGVYSFIRVRDNLLWEKGISLGIEARSTEPDGRHVRYELMGSIETASFSWVSPRHPEYQIGGPNGCMGCKAGWVKFTAFADPKDVSRLADLNFACITRWHPCTQQADVLPTAWKELQSEESAATKAFDDCAPPVIRVLSQEARRIVLANVIKLERHADEALVSVRRVRDGVPQYADEWQENTYTIPTSAGVRIGDRLLVFDDAVCPAVLATEQNLTAARQGATEGWVSPIYSLGLPFGTFNPPKINVR